MSDGRDQPTTDGVPHEDHEPGTGATTPELPDTTDENYRPVDNPSG